MHFPHSGLLIALKHWKGKSGIFSCHIPGLRFISSAQQRALSFASFKCSGMLEAGSVSTKTIALGDVDVGQALQETKEALTKSEQANSNLMQLLEAMKSRVDKMEAEMQILAAKVDIQSQIEGLRAEVANS